MTRLDITLTLALLSFFATLLFEAAHYKWQAAAAPLLATGTGLLLTILLLVKLFRTTPKAKSLEPSEPYAAKDVSAVFGFAAAIVSILLLGFTIGSTIFVIAYLYYLVGQKLPKAIIYSVPVPLLLELVIQNLVRVNLYDGYIFTLN